VHKNFKARKGAYEEVRQLLLGTDDAANPDDFRPRNPTRPPVALLLPPHC